MTEYYGWGGVLSSLLTLLLIVLVILAIIALGRTIGRHSGSRPGQPTRAEEILAERFARGEIDEEEYRRRLHTVRSPPS